MKEFKGFMKGVDLGGWLSQCPPTFEHYESFITEEDFKTLKSWGLDHVRIPVDFEAVETRDGAVREGGMEYVRRAADWCKKYDLNMVLDLHKTAGYSFASEYNENGFFTDADLQERFIKLWERFAKEFGNESDYIAFELLNEVTDKSYSPTWNKIMEKCVARIRVIAPDTWILVGSYWNNSVSAVKDLPMPFDDRIVYNFHCYEPMVVTHQGAGWVATMAADFRTTYPKTFKEYRDETISMKLDTAVLEGYDDSAMMGPDFFESLFREALDVAKERDVNLYCGEYGVIDLADVQTTLNWYKDITKVFDKYGIGRACWSYKRMNFGLNDEHYKPIIAEIIKCI